MTPRRRFAVLILGFSLGWGNVFASGLQVSPTSIEIAATETAQGLWLSNTGDNEVQAQVRVYRWTQEGGQDKLAPSRGLVISPPMLKLAAGERQLIRAIRLAPASSGPQAVQETYRMIIDELPVTTGGKKGLQFVLRYSVPVFVEPSSAVPSKPRLEWALIKDGKKALLEVSNAGAGSAQLASMTFVDREGTRTEVTPGLLGYVLPGAKMQWLLKPAADVFSNGGVLETLINGQTVQQQISLVNSSR